MGIEYEMSRKAVRDSEEGTQLQVEVVVEEPRLSPATGIDSGFNFHRSFSRSSRSSSSSGCPSNIGGLAGFATDFPAGGTIKKKPMVNFSIVACDRVREAGEDEGLELLSEEPYLL